MEIESATYGQECFGEQKYFSKVIQIDYDEDEISYDELLLIFF
ncbi:peptide-methionine (S)-S-oxide reductase [Hufsiella arboris]|nr:peptide-methionine (S)-S-oxide reductase [Hufsiella arboris]